MKIIKTYALSKDSLEEDIDGFIRSAKKGAYQYDYKYGQEGLKLIKAYFRMIEIEFKKQNFTTAKSCYKKLMFLLLQMEYNYFNYEDIVGKMNFEKFIGNYFTCLIKLSNVEELFKEYLEYLKVKEDYYFESANRIILTQLPEKEKNEFVKLGEVESEKVGEEEYAMHDLIYFQLELAKANKNKEKYIEICEKYKKIVDEEQKEEYEEDTF